MTHQCDNKGISSVVTLYPEENRRGETGKGRLCPTLSYWLSLDGIGEKAKRLRYLHLCRPCVLRLETQECSPEVCAFLKQFTRDNLQEADGLQVVGEVVCLSWANRATSYPVASCFLPHSLLSTSLPAVCPGKTG